MWLLTAPHRKAPGWVSFSGGALLGICSGSRGEERVLHQAHASGGCRGSPDPAGSPDSINTEQRDFSQQLLLRRGLPMLPKRRSSSSAAGKGRWGPCGERRWEQPGRFEAPLAELGPGVQP